MNDLFIGNFRRSLKRCDTSVEMNEDECMLVNFTLCQVLSNMVDLVILAQPPNKKVFEKLYEVTLWDYNTVYYPIHS